MDVVGKYILIEKHIITRKGKKKRRAYHEAEGLDLARELATKYAADRQDDFLLVQIVEEISKPETEPEAEELE
jgi:hypothetical protein